MNIDYTSPYYRGLMSSHYRRTPSPPYYQDAYTAGYASTGSYPYSPPMRPQEPFTSAHFNSPTSVADAPPMHHCTTSFTLQPAQKKKGVTFKSTATVRLYTNDASTEEKASLYYTKRELSTFGLEANAICTLSQELPDRPNAGTLLEEEARDDVSEARSSEEGSTDSMRGLELLMYPKRKHNKVLAQKSLLKYQSMLDGKSCMTPERKARALALAGRKLNLWSSLVALETARLDALRAYEGEYLVPLEYPPPVSVETPFPFYTKRPRDTWVADAESSCSYGSLAEADHSIRQQNKRARMGY